MKTGKTEIVVILDESGSMASVCADTIGGTNMFIEDQKKLPGEAVLTLVKFDHGYSVIHDGVSIQSVKPLDSTTYKPNGSTALLDALGRTINSVGHRLAALVEDERPSQVIFVVQTDGGENASREFSRSQVFEMIKHQREKYSWEFVFLGANQDAIASATSLGMNPTNALNYAHSGQGITGALRSVNKGMTAYRSSGSAQAKSFFSPVDSSVPDPDSSIAPNTPPTGRPGNS